MSEKPILHPPYPTGPSPGLNPQQHPPQQYQSEGYPLPPNYQNAGYASHGGYPSNPSYPPPSNAGGYKPDQQYNPNVSGGGGGGGGGGYGGGPSGSVPPIGFAQPPTEYYHPPKNENDQPYSTIDPELGGEPMVKGFDFSEESIRRGFIRKVYTILSMQLSVTLIFIFWFGYHRATNLWVSENLALAYVNIGVSFAIIIALACVESARRKTPLNLILLAIFTLAESYLVGLTTIFYQKEDVLMALGITTVVVVSLTIFAFQTKWDFTVLGGTLFVAVILLFVFGIIAAIWPGRIMILIYSIMGAIIFCIYLIYDTQKIIGGDHQFKCSPEEYILGTIALYLDIINIFLHILRIIAAAKK